MNQRIRELIDQAGTDVSGKWISLDNAEKFAELIILECDRYARGTWEHGELLGGDLKRLFGLEEPKGWICPKCNADRTKIACPLGFGATVDGRCPMTVEAQ
jgi:hypothetical protein